MVTSYVSEKWDLIDRDVDDEGRPMCHVRRITHTGTTVWRLLKRANGWYNMGTFIGALPKQGFRSAPVKLSNSRTDLTLASFAEHNHGHAYA